MKSDRYPMCKDQPAQIDCRDTDCKYNIGGGQCSNSSPAITLHPGYTCWSKKEKQNIEATVYVCNDKDKGQTWSVNIPDLTRERAHELAQYINGLESYNNIIMLSKLLKKIYQGGS